MQTRAIAIALFVTAAIGAASAQSLSPCRDLSGDDKRKCEAAIWAGTCFTAGRIPAVGALCKLADEPPSLDRAPLPRAPEIRRDSTGDGSWQQQPTYTPPPQSSYEPRRDTRQGYDQRQQDQADAQARAREDAAYAAEKARQRAASDKRQRDYEAGQRQFAEEAARQRARDDAAYAAEKARQRAASDQRYRDYQAGQQQFAEEAARQKAQDDAAYAAEKARQRAASEQRQRDYEAGQRQFAEEAARQRAQYAQPQQEPYPGYYRSPGGCTGCSPEYRQSQGLAPYAQPQPQPEPYPGYYNSPGGCTGCSPEYRRSIGLPPYPQQR